MILTARRSWHASPTLAGTDREALRGRPLPLRLLRAHRPRGARGGQRRVGVLTLDLGREPMRPRRLYAAYLLPDGEPTLVDCGAGAHLASLKVGLARHGVEVADLRHVLLTHVHLDHGGAAGALVAENPSLQVWVGARGPGT